MHSNNHLVIVAILQLTLCSFASSVSQRHDNKLPKPVSLSANRSTSTPQESPKVKLNVKPEVGARQGSLVDRSTHESLSPSSLSSIYNYINNKNAKQNEQPASPNQFNLNQNNRHFNNIPPSAGVALGRERESYSKPQMDGSEFIATPMLLPNVNNYAGLNAVVDPQMYDNQGMLPLQGQSVNQEQIYNQFYANNMAGAHQSKSKSPQTEAGSIENAYQHNMYNQQQPVHDQSLSMLILEDPLTGNRFLGDHQRHQLNPAPNRAATVTSAVSPITNEGGSERQPRKKKKMLTNDQLVTLIDELKEFNSKQASRIQSNILPEHPAATKEDNVKQLEGEKEEERLLKSASKNNLDDDSSEKESKEEPKSNLDTEDLAKFAKFLMTKEGSNLKFQLGLDKDAPDDGDEEEERDALLESKKKTSKTKPKRKKIKKNSVVELEDLDKKHSEVEAQMDKLITDMTGKIKKTGQHNNNRRKKKKRRRKEDDDMNDRKKRDHSSYPVTKEESRSMTIMEPNERKLKPVEQDKGENFAKMLIQKELLEDNSDANTIELPNKISIGNTLNKKTRRSNGIQMEPSSVRTVQGGDTYSYPKLERNKDQIALIHELQKSRKRKSKMRSRLPIAENSVLENGLNGEVQTELHPDGTLSLKTNNDVLTLKLPKRRSNVANSESTHKTDIKSDSQRPDSNHHSVDSVKIQSAAPLQDEYPISERVSDRLNKLSNNLDRYFNDGFLKEIDEKSKIEGMKSSEKDPRQSSTSNIQESKEKLGRKNKASNQQQNLKADQDFDVNVSIDGKRDPESENETESDPDEEPDQEKNEEKDTEDGDDRHKKRKQRKIKRGQLTQVNSDERNTQHQPEGSQKDKLEEQRKPSENERKSKHLRRDESSRKEKIEYENSGNILPNLDPVESENLDTPIGPDTDDVDADLTSAKKLKSTEESNVTTRYGKKVGGKFFEEPHWR